ncbi:MAG: hypothetical protein WBC44_18995 [Planctomycetaceae bacterium]
MSDAAHVTSVEAVARFTAALRQFEDEASQALLALDQQIGKALQWLDDEQPAYWRSQIRRQYDEVARTRNALENCQMRVVAGDRPSCLEEEKAHRAAKRRLEVASAKPDLVRACAIKVHREVDEYRGRVGQLQQTLDRDVPRTLALLERTQSALLAYLDQHSPTEEPPPAEESGRRESS